MEICQAKKEDASNLSYLLNLAGEGIPEYLWGQMTEGGETAMAVGTSRAAREEGGFSYRNAMVCREDGVLVGMILAYRQADPYKMGDISEYPEVVRPLVELEAEAPGSWYINAIATYEAHRGKGVARQLMAATEQQAIAAGCRILSLIVASGNHGAKRLYDVSGFTVRASRPSVPCPGCSHEGDWLLMTRSLNL